MVEIAQRTKKMECTEEKNITGIPEGRRDSMVQNQYLKGK